MGFKAQAGGQPQTLQPHHGVIEDWPPHPSAEIKSERGD